LFSDIYARGRRLDGDHVRFLGGTDDHSLKNVLAAEAAGLSTPDFVSAHADRFEGLRDPLDLSFDDFIRTSADERHRPAVQHFWRACSASGDFYRRVYEADYCIGCEQFYRATELIGGRCPEHGNPVERIVEQNWFFRLSAYQEYIEEIISSGKLVIRPAAFRDEALAFVRRGLHDISVSRSSARARGWGIRVPDDPTQVISVWFDALTNYISALGFGVAEGIPYQTWWRESDRRVHVIGKGILRFHAVYWPAFLASAGEPVPTHIQVHPYLSVDGEKLSKSKGTGVDPALVVAEFGTDALRWWFASDVAAVSDTDFTTDRLVVRANADLANGLGNVVNRIVALVHRHRGGVAPIVDVAPIEAVRHLADDVCQAIAGFELNRASQLIRQGVVDLNRGLETSRPWEVARRESTAGGQNPEALNLLLARLIVTARIIARAAEPIIPGLATRILGQLQAAGPHPAPEPLFPRIDRS
jgi:methionyl-tRNA synthetase